MAFNLKDMTLMQTFQIEVDDNVADKVLFFLENIKEHITIKKLDTSYANDLKKSIDDLNNNNIIAIDDVDSYIKKLKNEVK